MQKSEPLISIKINDRLCSVFDHTADLHQKVWRSEKKSYFWYLHFTADPEMRRSMSGEVGVSASRDDNEGLLAAGILTQEFFDECKRRNISNNMDLFVEFPDAKSAIEAWKRLGAHVFSGDHWMRHGGHCLDRYLFIDGEYGGAYD